MVKYYLSFLLCVYASVASPQGQKPRDFKREAAQLRSVLDKNHFRPAVLDDAFSAIIIKGLLNQLDPGHLYFNQQDLTNLDPFKNSLDEEWKGERWEFLPKLTEVYRNALKRGESMLDREMKRKISWTSVEFFPPQGEDQSWSKNDAEQQERWRIAIKHKALTEIEDLAASDSLASKKGLTFILSKEKAVLEHVAKTENKKLKRILGSPAGFENYVASVYFRDVAAYYDPHSLYLSPQEVEIFKAAVSTKTFAFGVNLGEDQNGNIIIERLLPGGPAWKSGELHQGDLLTGLTWEGQPPSDLTGATVEEVNDLLDRSNEGTLEFTVKESNGLKKIVPLKKEKIETQDNTVKGFLLKGSKKIGYISLPGFYTQWEADDVSSCANDVASEIIKLKGESIDGLILDIRSNGGGSLKEAVEMAGIFIDEGPLTVLGEKSGKTITLKDLNRGTVYDGPLIILIDGQSASASEILAGAIQDYNRGIIVGGSSFGKATGQVLIGLDTANHVPAAGGFGFVTVTQHRIYRVTGKSNQGVGVHPDIRLPDLYEAPAFHEMALPRAFIKDSLSKKIFFRALPVLPLPALRQKSAARTQGQIVFKNINEIKNELAEQSSEKMTGVELKWQHFIPEKSIPETVEAIKTHPTDSYEISFPEFNRNRMEMDSYLREYTRLWIRNLKEDPYVEEAFLIICDYLQSSK